MLKGVKVQPTFRLYPASIENARLLKERGVDVATIIDDTLRRAVKRTEKL